jgi:hypothetical protein
MGLDADGNPKHFNKAKVIDAACLQRQADWSLATFGPGDRTRGIMEHINKEFREILDDQMAGGKPEISEWIDVLVLALDGCWRDGMTPQEIIDKLAAKQAINEARTWPDWRAFTDGQAIEHVRD